MPVYHYKCSNCPEDFDIYHSIKEPLRTKCPNCFEETLGVVIDGPPLTSIKGEIKTIGQLAEANAKTMGKEQLHKKMTADGTFEKQKSEEARKQINKLASLSKEKQEKYIVTGKL